MEENGNTGAQFTLHSNRQIKHFLVLKASRAAGIHPIKLSSPSEKDGHDQTDHFGVTTPKPCLGLTWGSACGAKPSGTDSLEAVVHRSSVFQCHTAQLESPFSLSLSL